MAQAVMAKALLLLLARGLAETCDEAALIQTQVTSCVTSGHYHYPNMASKKIKTKTPFGLTMDVSCNPILASGGR